MHETRAPNSDYDPGRARHRDPQHRTVPASQFAEGASRASLAQWHCVASFDQAESVQRLYRQKCQLLADELQEVERLRRVLGVKDITDVTSIIRKREEFEEQLLADARQTAC